MSPDAGGESPTAANSDGHAPADAEARTPGAPGSPAQHIVNTARERFAFRSTAYLCAGTLCAMLGGAYSTYITFEYSADYKRNLNMEGEAFPSGHAYWPMSVSSMVNDIESPSGKVWLAFMVTSAFLTILSWYPYCLTNVYVGEEVPLFPWVTRLLKVRIISMMTARTLLPQLGMLMVALVHTAPANVWDPAQAATLIFHTGGAMLWIGVTLYTEIYALAFSKTVVIGKTEWRLRCGCIVVASISAVLYLIGQSFSPDDLGICCGLEYRPVTMETVEKAQNNGAYAIAQEDLALMQGAKYNPNATAPLYQGLYDSAKGGGLAWYMMEFWGEALSGAFMLLDLLIIWFFAKERLLVMPEKLDEIA